MISVLVLQRHRIYKRWSDLPIDLFFVFIYLITTMSFYLHLNKDFNNVTSLSKIKIENLIDEDLQSDFSNSAPSTRSSSISSISSISSTETNESIEYIDDSELIHPPHIIQIKNHEPLKLAKKKHYQPVQSATKIQKRRGSIKPQGRPFNSNLNARFLLFQTIEDLALNLLNVKSLKIGTINGDINDFLTTKDIEKGLNISNTKIFNNESTISPSFQLKSISFEKFNDSSNQIYNDLCSIFQINEISFIKIIRNNKGKLIKFEILSNILNNELNIDFIKKFITYPRYKSKMKIFLINKKFNENIWFYNDERMLIWDFKNLKLNNIKILINTNISSSNSLSSCSQSS